MLTRDDIFCMLAQFGIRHDDTLTIHASLRAPGPIEGGADGLIDALKEYLADGLLMIPTHTWDTVGPKHPVFDVRTEAPCIGTLAKVAAFRPDAVRTLHPTHSLALFGREAADYAVGEEHATSPAPVGGCLQRLYDRQGKILLLGVGHNRNTFFHVVDEMLDLPNRLGQPYAVTIIDHEGREHFIPAYRPHHMVSPEGAWLDCSARYPNYTPALEHFGAVQYGQLGNAPVICCDAKKSADAIMRVWSRATEDVCAREMELPRAWYAD